jgi:hypothetical protein
MVDDPHNVYQVVLVSGNASSNKIIQNPDLSNFSIADPRPSERQLAMDAMTPGVGVSTRSEIAMDSTTTSSPRSPGMEVMENAETKVAHEVFEHAWARGQGVDQAGDNPQTGAPWAEERAVATENIYRRAAGLPERLGYSQRPNRGLPGAR